MSSSPPNPPPVANHANAHQAIPSHILPEASLTALCTTWLLEDTPSFDVGSAALPTTAITATLYAKSGFTLAGSPFVDKLFALCSCSVEWHLAEGRAAAPAAGGRVAIACVRGPAAGVLRAERPALNALAECSGVATAARRAAEAAAGWGGRVAATRKTAPGLRLLQKYGVVVGGMDPHRMDLSAMAMLKDNHIAAAGSVGRAVGAVRRVLGFAGKVEVECETVGEAFAACEAGADVVMLDNYRAGEVGEAARAVKERFPHVLVEVSGNVQLDGLQEWMVDGVDVISLSVFKFRETVDVSLKVD